MNTKKGFIENKLLELNTRQKLLEAELLHGLIFSGEQLSKVLARMSVDDLRYYRRAFDVVVDAQKNGKNLFNELISEKITTSEFLPEHPIHRPIENITKEIVAICNTRKAIELFEKASLQISHDNIGNFLSEFQRELALSIASDATERSHIDSVIAEYREKQEFYKNKFKNGGGIIGVSTGFDKLDAIIDGFRPEHLWVVGGYTNMGKTACSLNFVSHLVKQGKRVVFYSLEMSKTDILSRLLGVMTEQNGITILKNFPHDTEKVSESMRMLIDSGMSIYSEKVNLAEIESSMTEEHLKKPVDLFVVDFLQNVQVKNADNEYQQISTAIIEFQQLAKRLKVPIMVLSQISNEGARNTNDSVMSFKGSGTIAAAADIAIELMYGEEDKADRIRKINEGQPVSMKWNIRKNRHGKVGHIDMSFNGRTGVFQYSEFEKM